MANQSTFKLIGIVLMVIGLGLAYWGFDMSGSFDSQLNQAFSGSNTNDVMFRYIGGAASFAAGIFLFLKK
jgi:hypothetical protein